MGKGKGDPVGFIAEVRPGRIMFEIDGVDATVAAEALRKAGTKLPVKTKVVGRI
jgi:large subunit ribosomal protein L16